MIATVRVLMPFCLVVMPCAPIWANTDPQVAAYAIPKNAVKKSVPVAKPAKAYEYRDPKTHELVGREYFIGKVCVSRDLYKHGRRYGVQREWYPNGTLKIEAPYKNGLMEGTARGWNQLGQLTAQEEFKAGTGRVRFYADNGHLKQETNFKSGKMDGADIMFDADGKVQHLELFHANISVGPRLIYSPDASLRAIYWLGGPFIEFNPDGSVKQKQWILNRKVATEAAYKKYAASHPKAPSYFADATRYKSYATPQIKALVQRYDALPAVQIPLKFDAHGNPLKR